MTTKSTPVQIVNLTPHEIRCGQHRFHPSGAVARALEEVTPGEPILARGDSAGAPVDVEVPTGVVRYAGTDLPPPRAGVVLIVSAITASAARESGRTVDDLLVPGEQVRDSAGRVVGCRSLIRVADPGHPLSNSALDQLARVASWASPGPWSFELKEDGEDSEYRISNGHIYLASIDCMRPEFLAVREEARRNAAFIAAANPLVVRALISRVRYLERLIRDGARDLERMVLTQEDDDE